LYKLHKKISYQQSQNLTFYFLLITIELDPLACIVIIYLYTWLTAVLTLWWKIMSTSFPLFYLHWVPYQYFQTSVSFVKSTKFILFLYFFLKDRIRLFSSKCLYVTWLFVGLLETLKRREVWPILIQISVDLLEGTRYRKLVLSFEILIISVLPLLSNCVLWFFLFYLLQLNPNDIFEFLLFLMCLLGQDVVKCSHSVIH
jgi:hypothetical protein